MRSAPSTSGGLGLARVPSGLLDVVTIGRLLGLLAALASLAGCPASSPTPVWLDERTGMELVWLAPGELVMGSPPGELGRESQEVQHTVRISRGFYMGRTEVTQAQWRAVMGDDPSEFSDCGGDCPVENVSWYQVQEFLERLNRSSSTRFRLPTEAEWESACRAGSTAPFATGSQLSTDDANYDGDPAMPGWPGGSDRGRTLPVASFAPNAWGLFDFHGNVWEWTADDHCPYPQGPLVDPLASCDSGLKVIRGGSWHFGPDSARCALRYTHRPQDIGPSLGFRVVMEAPSGAR